MKYLNRSTPKYGGGMPATVNAQTARSLQPARVILIVFLVCEHLPMSGGRALLMRKRHPDNPTSGGTHVPVRIIRTAGVALLAVTLFALVGIGSTSAQEGPAAVQPPPSACPVPIENVQNGVDVCVDRGDGSVYQVGDPITICVTANIPQPAIFPPPPPPTIRVVNSVNGGPEQLIFETAMASGQECLTATIVPPTGQEVIRADAIGNDGRIFATDAVSYTSTGGFPVPQD